MKTIQTLSNKERLLITLLDKPQIKVGEKILDFQYRKSIALLAFLATTRKAYSREYLAGFLWGKIAEKNAQAGLRKILSEINTHLSPYLLMEKRQIGLNFQLPIDVDIFTFQQNFLPVRQKSIERVTREEIERLEYALTVYQTGFMTGFYIQKAPAFEDWLSMQRENLQVLMIEALQLASNYSHRVGEFQKSMAYTRRLLTIEPALEEAHYKLMSLLALDGQRTLALNQYDVCKKVLAKTYGTLPQDETTTLYKKIRAEPKIRKQNKKLPVPSMSILGRDEDIQHVIERLHEEDCRLLTIMGPGGVGKTHLALMVGKQINEQSAEPLRDGAVFVPLQALQSVHSLSSTIAYQLGYTYDKDVDPVQQLCDYLAPFSLLIILDNFEQLIPSMQAYAGEQYEFINRILQAAPGVKILITSRIRLNFQGEYIYHLQGISYPENETYRQEDLQNYPAVALFMQRTGQLLGNYQADDNDIQAVVEICRFVNGLPLGILLAAGWIRLLPAGEIARKITGSDQETSVAFLTSGGSDMPKRHRNMESVYRQSWDMITGQQQQALAELSIFDSSFNLEAAQAISPIPLTGLVQLIDHSLLDRNESGRLQMHDLLRQYVKHKGIDVQPARERSCNYFSKKIIAWEKAIKGKDQVQAIHEMNMEIDNLRGMWNYAIASKKIICLVQIFEGLCLFYDWRHFYSEGLNFCEKITKMLRENSSFPESFSEKQKLRFLSRTLTWQSIFAASSETETLLRQSLFLLEDSALRGEDIRSEKAFAFHILAAYVSQTGRLDEAFDLYNKSIAIYEEIGDDWYLQKILTSYGPLLWDRSAYENAYQVFERTLRIARKIGDQRGIAYALIWLGNISIYRGDFTGEIMIRESYSILEQIGNEMGGIKGRNQLCSSLYMLGLFDEACELMQTERYDEKKTFRQDIPQTLYAIGLIHTGRYEQAKLHADSGLKLARTIKEDYSLCLAIMTKSWLQIIDKEYEHALSLLKEGSEHARTKDIKELFSWTMANLGLTEILSGNLELARDHLVQALEMALEINGYGAKCSTLAAVSLWMKAAGYDELCIACYDYIRQCPIIGNSVWYKQMVGDEILPLMSGLPDEAINSITKRFTEFSLEEVIDTTLQVMTARASKN